MMDRTAILSRGGVSVGEGLPPYGPVRGMLDGVALIERLAPDAVDRGLLRQHRIAPGNEYKVLHALRFLGLIDAEGRPTPSSRVLRTKGATRTDGLRQIIRRAYADLLGRLDLTTASRDDVHNYFVTQHNLSRDLAAKAAGFFLELCRMAALPAPPPGSAPAFPTVAAEVSEPPAPASDDAGRAGRPSRAASMAGGAGRLGRAEGAGASAHGTAAARPPGIDAVGRGAWAAQVGAASGGAPAALVILTADDVESRSDAELRTLFARVKRAWLDAAQEPG